MEKEALDHTCPSCGAKITFEPKTQTWDCEYCGSKFTLEELKKHQNAASDNVNQKKLSKSHKKIDVFRCDNCGAEIMADEHTTATFCVYCGSTAILKERIEEGVPPTLIIPFKNEKEDAIIAFKKVVKKPLTPGAFKSEKNIEKITGVYIPFWAHDLEGNGLIQYDAVDKRTWRSGDYIYTETRRYDVEVDGHIIFDKVLTDASSRFDDALMDSLEPFQFQDLVEYNHAYLSGFFAEKYDVEQEQGFERAKTRCYNTCMNMMNARAGHHLRTVRSNAFQLNFNECYCIMLPVWMVNIKYKNKIYTFAMNGDTGKIVGNIPIGVGKILLWSALLFLGFFLIGFTIVYLGGGAI